MIARAAISKLRGQLLSALPPVPLTRLRQELARGLARLSRWMERGELAQPASQLPPGCPGALPGLNQNLVQETWLLAQRRMVCTDGRLRLGGSRTLDICATRSQTPRAIRHFACWLDYLAADGIGVEIRKLDGWRTCAIVDGIAVPVRIRERMHRVQSGNRLSAMIERWMGGRMPTVLVPSGRMELQLLRMGVSFASFPVQAELKPSTMEEVAHAIRGMAKREVEYQQRMHAVAVGEMAKRQATRKASSQHRKTAAESQSPNAMPVAANPHAENLAGLAALSALGSAQIRELIDAMERFAESAKTAPPQLEAEVYRHQMSDSVAYLAEAISRSLDLNAGEAGLNPVAMISGAPGSMPGPHRGRRSRHVA